VLEPVHAWELCQDPVLEGTARSEPHVVASPLALGETPRRVHRDDPAVIDDGDAIAQALGLVHEVSDEQNRDPAVSDVLDQPPGVTPGLGVEAGRQLVENGDPRIPDQGERDRQPLLGDKEEHFQGKGKDPQAVQSHIEEYLKNDGFTIQTSAPSEQGVVIQARKGGFLRSVVDADRSMTITITGTADDLTVRIGIGKWLQHLGVAAIETLLVSDLFLVVDVAESAWNFEIEDKLVKDLKAFVG